MMMTVLKVLLLSLLIIVFYVIGCSYWNYSSYCGAAKGLCEKQGMTFPKFVKWNLSNDPEAVGVQLLYNPRAMEKHIMFFKHLDKVSTKKNSDEE